MAFFELFKQYDKMVPGKPKLVEYQISMFSLGGSRSFPFSVRANLGSFFHVKAVFNKHFEAVCKPGELVKVVECPPDYKLLSAIDDAETYIVDNDKLDEETKKQGPWFINFIIKSIDDNNDGKDKDIYVVNYYLNTNNEKIDIEMTYAILAAMKELV